MGVKGALTLLNRNITLKVWGLPLLKHFYLSNSKERKVKVLVAQSSSTLCNPTTTTCQAPPSMEFSRQEYWRVLPCSPPGGLPNLGI